MTHRIHLLEHGAPLRCSAKSAARQISFRPKLRQTSGSARFRRWIVRTDDCPLNTLALLRYTMSSAKTSTVCTRLEGFQSGFWCNGCGGLSEKLLAIQSPSVTRGYLYALPNDVRAACRLMRQFMPNIDDLLSMVPSRGTADGMRGMLDAMILGAWTAFETLAGDLWETALNIHPVNLSDLGGNHDRIQKAAEKRLGVRLPPLDNPKKIKPPAIKVTEWGSHHRQHSGCDSARFATLGLLIAARSRGRTQR